MKQLPVTAFELKLEIPIAAPPARVWEALVGESAAWWPRSFLSADTKGMVIEPKVGGRVFDDRGGGEGVMWYWVIGVESPHWILCSGFYGPPYGGPGTSYLRLALTPKGKNETLLEITDASFGHLAGCDNESGWREIFEKNFAAYVKTAKKPAKRRKT
jgi:uncharacterized protein YndB with AHSA1/START domain